MSSLFNLFYIYDPWLFHFVRMSLVAGALAAIFLAYKWYKKQIQQIIIPMDSLIAVVALIGISFLPMLIHRTGELGVIAMYIKMLIVFLFGIVIYNLVYAQNGRHKFIRDLEIGIGVQSALGVLALAGIPLFISIALDTNADYFLPRFIGSEQEYRLYNFTSTAFFQLSAFYLMLLHFLLAYGEKQYKLNAVYIFLILCIGLISGRTFLVLSFVSLAIYFKWRYLPAILIFAALILFLALQFQGHRYVEHALEPLINLLRGGQKISASTETLVQKHLFVPQLKQILFGDGLYYVDGKRYYGGSDSGFIRQALYGGIAYILACLLFTFYFVKRIADNWFNGSWKFILSTMALLSVLNIKADTYAFPGTMFILLMFISLFGEKGKQIIILRKNHV